MLIVISGFKTAWASESDPWTYAYIPLADSHGLLSERLEQMIQTVIDTTNSRFADNLQQIEDSALAFSFFTEFRARYIRDVTWGLFERCIGSNGCPGWPQFERIQMYPEESVYHAAGWRYIPARFHLASVIEVCGVRMGADKLTHFFDDGFHYYNASQSRPKNLNLEDIRRISMSFEKSYMGTRLTGIISHADILANLAGLQFYNDLLQGRAPIIGRNADGRLIVLRSPDICDYVSAQFDERVLANEYTYSLINTTRARQRRIKLQRVIEARASYARTRARETNEIELASQSAAILTRRIPMTHWQSDFPRMRLFGYGIGAVSQMIFDSGFRRGMSAFAFNPLKQRKMRDRKTIVIKRVEAFTSALDRPGPLGLSITSLHISHIAD